MPHDMLFKDNVRRDWMWNAKSMCEHFRAHQTAHNRLCIYGNSVFFVVIVSSDKPIK